VRLHLCADLVYQGNLVRFIENHDEPRARSAFSPEKERAAALSLPLSRVQNFFMKASWREESSGFLSSFEGAPLNLQILSSGFSTARF
jgi:hypothetical protein